MAQKKIPARQCIGCLTSRPKKELVRVVRAKSELWCKIMANVLGIPSTLAIILHHSSDLARTTRTSSFLGRLVRQPMHWRAGIFFCAIRFSLLRQVFRAYSAAVSSVFSASAAFGSSSP